MKQKISCIAALVCALIVSVSVCADRNTTVHNFASMPASDLVFTNSNKTATTPLTVYTCSGPNAVFGLDHAYNSQTSIRLPKYGSTVTTSCINELSEFTITYEPIAESRLNLKVQVSKDSVNWGYPLSTSDSIAYSTGSITVTLPRNNYYVRIKNTNSSDVSIRIITYYQDHCNCFIYTP